MSFSLKTFQISTSFRVISLARPLWMAIVNATPDSFSDGGRKNVAEYAITLLRNGADILDIGGESTRPGAEPLDPKDEISRIAPVIRGIHEICLKQNLPKPFLSIDTYHPQTAAFALEQGVELINDISGGEDPEMIRLVKKSNAALCFMHKQGIPKTMQNAPQYENVLEEVFEYLQQRKNALLDAGIPQEKLIADPGIGFGKTFEQNWTLIENISRFHDLELPILVGHSRKGFLQKIINQNPEITRDDATHQVSRFLIQQNIQILRTHVKPLQK
ncbi:MAG: dihydropteroate synthase [Planctomycetia bacterium]|nr:dihydropteroate synthase [Planctomycetia bacterium]